MATNRKTRLVYLGGPIRALSREKATSWRKQAADLLYESGLATFDPAGAWLVPNHHTNGRNDPVLETHLQIANDTAVALSDACVFAYFGVPSLGTDREIELALSLRKPIVILSVEVDSTVEGFIPISEWLLNRFPSLAERLAAPYLPMLADGSRTNPRYYQTSNPELALWCNSLSRLAECVLESLRELDEAIQEIRHV